MSQRMLAPLPAAKLLLFSVALCSVTLCTVARGDLVVLKSGGEIRGEVLKSVPGEVVVRTLSGAEIKVSQPAVDSVTKRRLAVEEYETLRRQTPDTVEDHWVLAEFCRERTMKTERERHLRRIIALEPDHLLARRGLGYFKHEGEWTTQDELKQSKGYVKFKGKWVLPQELDLLALAEKETELEKSWYKKVNLWRDWLAGDRVDRQNEGYRNLVGIEDANAVPALYRAFNNHTNEEARVMYVSILKTIAGAKVVGPLVFQSLKDPSDRVRMTAIRAIPEDLRSDALPIYAKALKNELNVVVNRAGLAVGMIGDETMIPNLINALVTRHVYETWVPDQDISIGLSQNGNMAQVQPNYLPPDIQALMATGQLPYGVGVNQQPVRKKLVTLQKDEENPAVLIALNKLTSQDYGYNEKAWKAWWNASHGFSRKKA